MTAASPLVVPKRKPPTKIGTVIFPGDVMTLKQATGKVTRTRIGIGLTPIKLNNHDNHGNDDHDDNTNNQRRKHQTQEEGILCTRAGVLRCKFVHPPKLWVANRQRRYIPYSEDRVLGIITHRTGMYYEVDINGPRVAILGCLEFEGATKRNKPELEVGNVVFARVVLSNKDMSPIISCKSDSFENNKSWVTNESLFMQLKGEHSNMFTISLDWCRRLNRIRSPHLIFLARFFPFEVAIGLNGRIWINTHETMNTLLLTNILQNGQFMNMTDFQVMTHTLLRKYAM